MKRKLFLSVMSGVLCALALPRPGIWLLSWIGLAPLLIALRNTRTSAGALYGLVAGTTYFAIILYWICLFGYLPWVLLAIMQGAFIAVFAAVASHGLNSRTTWLGRLAVPAAWTAVQFARGLGPYGFTWGSFAHTQANNLLITQIASITGPWGIDFIVCLANLAISQTVFPAATTRRLRLAACTCIVLVAVMVSGWIQTKSTPRETEGVNVAIVQGNLIHDVHPSPDFLYQSLQTYTKMTLEAAQNRPEIIVWPETTLITELDESGLGSYVAKLARRSESALLIGALDSPSQPSVNGSYNAAYSYDSSGRKTGVYHKVRLVPFGEFVPMRGKLRLLERYEIRDEDVIPGEKHTLLPTPMGGAGVSICFESIFPQVSRREVLDGAAVLFVLTNDSWFEKTQAARQHLMMSKLRAVENRRWLARAASTGISTVIDPWGRQHGEIEIFRSGTLYARVQPRQDLTLYTRLGDWFAWACVVLAAVSLIRAIVLSGVRAMQRAG